MIVWLVGCRTDPVRLHTCHHRPTVRARFEAARTLLHHLGLTRMCCVRCVSVFGSVVSHTDASLLRTRQGVAVDLLRAVSRGRGVTH